MDEMNKQHATNDSRRTETKDRNPEGGFNHRMKNRNPRDKHRTETHRMYRILLFDRTDITEIYPRG